MVQLRRLDPLANSGPYQRLLKSPVKSLTLTEAQYERVKAQRPDFIVTEGEAAVIGLPYRDRIEIHYGFPEVEAFRDRFTDLFNQLMAVVTKDDAPRGVILAFRDRPNRSTADTIFWPLTLEEGEQWVEMNYFAVPEQPEPADAGEGFSLRDVIPSDHDAIAKIEAGVSGKAPLRQSAITGMIENAKLFRIVLDASGEAIGYVSLRTDPGGWGVIEEIALPAAGLRGITQAVNRVEHRLAAQQRRPPHPPASRHRRLRYAEPATRPRLHSRRDRPQLLPLERPG
jgi:hypothetical protein